MSPPAQATYWLLTIPHHAFTPFLPPTVAYIRGQLESGSESGYIHWQLLVIFTKKCRLRHLKSIFGTTAHAEPSRSAAADAYVWKDETSVPGTRFELGERPIKRNNSKDWDRIREMARRGQLEDIPGDVYVRNYGNLKRYYTISFFKYYYHPILESLWIMLRLLQSSEKFSCSGVQLVQGNLDEPGTRPVWTLILKIQGVNSGNNTYGSKI